MKILVINAGSSSVKYQLFKMPEGVSLCSGKAERVGEPDGAFITHRLNPGSPEERKTRFERTLPDHASALKEITQILTSADWGVISDLREINGVGHRVVQGGELFKKSVIVDDQVKEGIRKLIPLAPLHNPANLQGIEVAMQMFPHAESVAVFDTEFHQTLRPVAYTYPLPYRFYEQTGLRRYGFHGISHRYVAHQAARMLKQPIETLMLITCHLGSGASVAAISGGKCIDTSMGLTPMAGLVMGTRSGDIDPSIHGFLMDNTGMSNLELEEMFNRESGLLGICGRNDMRDIHNARQNGDKLAQLAFEIFCYSVKKYIGAYVAALGRVDAVIFTAGIGENDPLCRKQICKGLEGMGIVLNRKRNLAAVGEQEVISMIASPVKVLVVPTNEEKEIAASTWQVLTVDDQCS
ncbi:MAG: acetate kinase [Desulfovibrionaceae bacterium]|nr:acetate kinase [Desulfovibrionaceae bacterium]